MITTPNTLDNLGFLELATSKLHVERKKMKPKSWSELNDRDKEKPLIVLVGIFDIDSFDVNFSVIHDRVKSSTLTKAKNLFFRHFKDGFNTFKNTFSESFNEVSLVCMLTTMQNLSLNDISNI
jgi:hypothetical protein